MKQLQAGRAFLGRGHVLGVSIFIAASLLHLHSAKAQLIGSTNFFTQPFNITNSLIGFQPATRQQLFRESDTVTIQTSNNLAVTVFDLYGNIVYQGAPTNLHFSRGHYFVQTDGDRSQFVVLPNDYAGASFLGTDADTGWNELSQKIQQIQPVWVRTGAALWETVQPLRGVWDWSQMDAIVSSNLTRRITVSAASVTPPWVQANELVSVYPTFVQAMATRYKGKLTAIEIWNEPWYNKFPGGTNLDQNGFVQLYLSLQAAGRQAIKAVDTNVMVVGPDWDGMQRAESLAMTASNLDLFDAWTWHDYSRGSFAPDQDHLDPSWVRSISAQNLQWCFGDGVIFKPMYVNELGLYGHSALGCPGATNGGPFVSNLDWYQGMCRAVKITVMYRAAGIGCLMPEVIDLANEEPNPSLDPNLELYGWDYGYRGPHPKTTAFLMSCYWLNGATLTDYRTPGQQVFLYAWQRTNNTSLVIAWHLDGGFAPLAATGLTMTDIYGQSIQTTNLTELPLVFQSSTLSPSALLSNVMAALPNLNMPPVFSNLDNQAVLRGQTLQFTVSATDSNHNPLTYSASPLPAGASLDPSSGVFTWTTTTNQAGTYSITFTATDDQGMSVSTSATIVVAASLSDGLAHLWHLDEGAGLTTADSIGACTGTLTFFDQAPQGGWTTGIQSNALNFDGVRTEVKLNDSTLFLTNNFAVSVWVKPQNVTAVGPFLCIHSMYMTGGLRFTVQSGQVDLQGETTTGYHESLFGLAPLKTNTWYHFAIVYNQSTITLYINGVNQGSASWGGDIVMDPSLFSYIGTENSDYFHGIIDEVRIYTRTLGDQEILQLYQGPLQPPVFTPISQQLVRVGDTLVFSVSASDPNGRPLTYGATLLPSGASFDVASRTFTWAPAAKQVGSTTAVFTANNGVSVATQQVSIAVSAAPAGVPALPALTVIGPANYQVFTNSGIFVTGTAVAANGIQSVTINGNAASVSPINWSAPAALSAGTNTIMVVATDGSYNPKTSTQTVHAVFQPAPSSLPQSQAPVFVSPPTVTNALLQLANLVVVAPGDTNLFHVAATDPGSNTLYYTWTFGDGTGSSRSTQTDSSYSYSGCGPYTASVLVDDGTYSNNANFTVSVACQLSISKLQSCLNFSKASADTCTIKGTLGLPVDYKFPGKVVTLDVAGAVASSTLNKQGGTSTSSLSFSKPGYNKRTGLWQFTAALKKGSWKTPWAAYGLINTNQPGPGSLVNNFPVVLVIDGESFAATTNLHYTAKAGRSGTAK